MNPRYVVVAFDMILDMGTTIIPSLGYGFLPMKPKRYSKIFLKMNYEL